MKFRQYLNEFAPVAAAYQQPALNQPAQQLTQQPIAQQNITSDQTMLQNIGLSFPVDKNKLYPYLRSLTSPVPEIEQKVLLYPYAAYLYTKYARKGQRWPEAEKSILMREDSVAASNYATYIIKGRWPEAEKMIAKSPAWSYEYLVHFQDPWFFSTGLASILNTPYWALKLAINHPALQKEPWKEKILKDLISHYSNTKDVPEGEYKRDPALVFITYADKIMHKRWPEAEEIMKKSPQWGNYATKYIK